jgi:coenzyme F420 hydrogenase subunit beta
MVDVVSRGLRPVLKSDACAFCGTCVRVCPGVGLTHEDDGLGSGEWGPVLQVWEGYAADEQLRFKGSSGGAATALAHYCIDREGAEGVLQTQPDPLNPLRNKAVFSRTRDELLAGTGSRYSPAAPCERFDWLLNATRPAVFVGKPCDVAALAKFKRVYPDIGPKTAVSISIFCAGTPSTQGTIEVLKRMGVEAGQGTTFRYRGNGWPGKATAQSGSREQAGELTYLESWGEILSRHVAFRCRFCPDSSGEFADISCGDPWYRTVDPDDPGRSMVIARTERGQRLVQRAVEAGYLLLEPADRAIIPRSQKSLLNKRRSLWARLAALRLFGIPAPSYRGFHLFAGWRRLLWKQQVKSFIGTVRRIIQRKWYLPDPEETSQ